MPLALPPGGVDPGIFLGFAAASCVWVMSMTLEWSGRRHELRGTNESRAIVEGLAWEDAPADAPATAEERARAA